MNKRQFFSSLALVALMGLTACGQDKPAFRGVDITGADYAQGWALRDQNGQERTLKDFAGKVVIVFFGYTQCPDVCPTTMIDLKQTMKLLGPRADEVQVLFVTLDPERDTQAVLAQFVPSFDTRFIGLRGDESATKLVQANFKIYAKKGEALFARLFYLVRPFAYLI